MNGYMTLENIKTFPESAFPMMCLANGFTSLFGYLISATTKDFWTHFQWLRNREEFASQWWYFKIFTVEHFRSYSLKLWTNPDWTTVQRAVIQQCITNELARPKWETRYDFIGILGEAFHLPWLNSPRHDFCSEKVNILSKVDEGCAEWMKTNPHPTPEEINAWFKTQERFKIVGRIMPG
jgi:hypothetical protein